MAVNALGAPSCRLEALHLIDRVRHGQRPVDRDAIVIEQHDQLVQLLVPCQRDGFLADAFHQVAVGGQHIGVVVDSRLAELGGEHALGHGHADRRGNALSEWSGGGFDTGRVPDFRMSGRFRMQLPEALDLVESQARCAGEIEQRIDQHRAMAGRQHEAVTVRPGRIGGIELEHLREQHGRHIGGPHRQTGVARLGLLDRIHGQHADGIGEEDVLLTINHGVFRHLGR